VNDWNYILDRIPPEGFEVETMICDDCGTRNVQNLKRKGSLWFLPDMSMYVYYRPTHWRAIDSARKGGA